MDWLDWAAKIWAINRATASLRTGRLIGHADLEARVLDYSRILVSEIVASCPIREGSDPKEKQALVITTKILL